MRQESGKGTVKWIFIICVIIIVVVVIVQYIMGVLKKERIKEMQADLLLVQAKVEIVKGKNNLNKDENPLKGIQVSKIAEKVNIKGIMEKKNISSDDFAKYYVLRNSDLSEMDLQELIGKNSGSYIVNYDNFEVIYTEGYENLNGLFCYKISELNKQPENPIAAPAVSTDVEENSENANTSAEITASEETNQTTETTTSDEANQTTDTTPQTAVENADEKYSIIINKWKSIIK